MALITCRDCDKEISSRAESCVYCGCPSDKAISRTERKKSLSTSAKLLIVVLIIVILTILFLYGLWNSGLGLLDYGLKELFS